MLVSPEIVFFPDFVREEEQAHLWVVICIPKKTAPTVGLGLWVASLPAEKQNIKLDVYSGEPPKPLLPNLVGAEAVEAIIVNSQGRAPRGSQLPNTGKAHLALKSQPTAGQDLLVALLPR